MPNGIKAPDPKTGNEVWQITDHEAMSMAVYFERQAFTADDRYLVFCSVRTGKWQIFRADLTNGELAQMTADKGIDPFMITIHPDGEHVWFIYEKMLYRINVASLTEQVVIDFRDQFTEDVGFSSSFTADGRYTTITTVTDTECNIYRVDLENKKLEHALRWTEGPFSHVLICPTNPDLITFVPGPDTQQDMSLPMEKRARTWMVDMKSGVAKQFLTMPYGFSATHETFSADGKRFYFYRKERSTGEPVTVCSVDQQGGDFRGHYYGEKIGIAIAHGISSNDSKWFLTDGDDPGHNPLILFNLETGEDLFLCWPDSTIKKFGQYSHVHPSLSKSMQFACYTSDVSGVPQVYVVPINVKKTEHRGESTPTGTVLK